MKLLRVTSLSILAAFLIPCYGFADATNVRVSKVQKRNIPVTIRLIGGLYAKRSVEISPQLGGQLEAIKFRYGQLVEKGQALFVLDDSLYHAEFDSAKAALRLSQLTYDRNLKLVKANAVSKQIVDKVNADYQGKQAELKKAKTQLEKMQILAPFTGVIGASQVDVGQFVRPGDSLAKLIDKASLIVKYSVPEQYFPRLKTGQQISITSSTHRNKKFQGKVTYVAPSVDSETRTVEVWGEIPNQELLLAPGLFVRVTQTIGESKSALVIPAVALIPSISGNNVFIVKDNKALKKAVTLDRIESREAVISAGLDAGEQVVVSGQEKLQQDTPVRIQP